MHAVRKRMILSVINGEDGQTKCWQRMHAGGRKRGGARMRRRCGETGRWGREEHVENDTHTCMTIERGGKEDEVPHIYMFEVNGENHG